MNILVKYKGELYRFPTQKAMDEITFQVFQKRNASCEVLIFPITTFNGVSAGHAVAPIETLVYVGCSKDT